MQQYKIKNIYSFMNIILYESFLLSFRNVWFTRPTNRREPSRPGASASGRIHTSQPETCHALRQAAFDGAVSEGHQC